MHGFLLIDKPAGPTSNDILTQLKRSLGTKKLGHTGTLDPFATGLLVVGVGEALKYIQYLKEEPKVYEATLKLGEETDTLDCKGQVTSTLAIPDLSETQISQVTQKFLGDQLQIPPMYSAKKIDGERLYDLAREGVVVERKACAIVISSLDILSWEKPWLKFRAACSRGTYIRVLGSDLAKALGTCGHLTELRRVSVGDFSIGQEEVVALGSRDSGLVTRESIRMIFISKALAHIPQIIIDSSDAAKLMQGKILPLSHSLGIYRIESEGRFLGLAESSDDSLKALRMMSGVK